jgi:phage replication-related protein YjqB (UPF0714/DUF867 family)
MPDKYKSFEELRRAEPRAAFEIISRKRNSPVVIAAPHGGGIEPGTSEIARSIAGDEFSYYLFEGRKATDNGDLHITSNRFDEPQGLALVTAAEFVLAVHGEADQDEIVYIGGLDEGAKLELAGALQEAGYAAREPGKVALAGRDKFNICNRGVTGAGVQLELSLGLRRSFFRSLDRTGRQQQTDKLAPFAAVVREVLLERFAV